MTLLTVIIFTVLFRYNIKKGADGFLRIFISYPPVHVNVYNFSSKLESWNDIPCKRSAVIRKVSATICFHNINIDKIVSAEISKSGVFESRTVDKLIYYVKKFDIKVMFDIGANVGQFSMYSAKMGLRVISVEPFYDNCIRLHKSAKLEGLNDRITLVQNALSNKPMEWKLLNKIEDNIGAQSLLPNNEHIYSRKDLQQYGNYLVNTITMDDLLGVIEEKYFHNRAIMKVDIEGFEVYAFQQAANLFNYFDVKVIFMEWVWILKRNYSDSLVDGMLDFFISHQYFAYNPNTAEKLYVSSWTAWPNEVVWLQDNNAKDVPKD